MKCRTCGIDGHDSGGNKELCLVAVVYRCRQMEAALQRCINECGCGWSAQGEYGECKTDSIFAPNPCAICAAKGLL